MATVVIDRPIDEIIKSLLHAIACSQIKGQLAHDIEKLCAQAARAPKE